MIMIDSSQLKVLKVINKYKYKYKYNDHDIITPTESVERISTNTNTNTMGKLTPAESVERGHDNTAGKYQQPGKQQDVPESDMKKSENKPEIES